MDNDITIQLGELDETELQSLVEIKSPSSECRIRILHSDSVFRKKNDRIAKGSVMVSALEYSGNRWNHNEAIIARF